MACEPLTSQELDQMADWFPTVVPIMEYHGDITKIGKWLHDNLHLVIDKYRDIKGLSFTIEAFTEEEFDELDVWLIEEAMANGCPFKENVYLNEYWFDKIECIVDKYLEMKGF